MAPQKRLLSQHDMEIWTESNTFNELIGFITKLGESVKGRENTQYVEPISSSIDELCSLLDKVSKVVSSHPVIQDANTSRFGKVEFRDFYDDLSSRSSEMISSLSDKLSTPQVDELAAYFRESWGNRTRIDYGSGHELNFICFLYGLNKCDFFDLEKDATNVVLRVFIKYLDVMRTLETKYWLEPAGSHGVWGLDDYHFLPFLFGAFQLATHKHLKPKSIHNKEFVEMFEKRYLYFGCIGFIDSVKTSISLRWHSPMLDDISGVKTWSKVAEGMVKMYKAEVLGKLPIMQHFYFGDFLVCPKGVSEPRSHSHDDSDDFECHDHAHNTWGDCCGIKIPSAIAATEAEKNKQRPIPFD